MKVYHLLMSLGDIKVLGGWLLFVLLSFFMFAQIVPRYPEFFEGVLVLHLIMYWIIMLMMFIIINAYVLSIKDGEKK